MLVESLQCWPSCAWILTNAGLLKREMSPWDALAMVVHGRQDWRQDELVSQTQSKCWIVLAPWDNYCFWSSWGSVQVLLSLEVVLLRSERFEVMELMCVIHWTGNYHMGAEEQHRKKWHWWTVLQFRYWSLCLAFHVLGHNFHQLDSGVAEY